MENRDNSQDTSSQENWAEIYYNEMLADASKSDEPSLNDNNGFYP